MIVVIVISAIAGLIMGKKIVYKPIKIEFKISPLEILQISIITSLEIIATMMVEMYISNWIVSNISSINIVLRLIKMLIENGVLITISLPLLSRTTGIMIQQFDLDLLAGYKIDYVKLNYSLNIVLNCIFISILCWPDFQSGNKESRYVFARVIIWLLTAVGTCFGIGYHCEGRIESEIGNRTKNNRKATGQEDGSKKHRIYWMMAVVFYTMVLFVQLYENSRFEQTYICIYKAIFVGMLFVLVSVWWNGNRLYPSEKVSDKKLKMAIAKIINENVVKSRYRTVSYSLEKTNSRKRLVVSMGNIIWQEHEDDLEDRPFELDDFDYEKCKDYLEMVVKERKELIQRGYRICKESAKNKLIEQSIYGDSTESVNRKKDDDISSRDEPKVKGIIVVIIGLYIIVGIAFPMILQYVISEKTKGSIALNYEWIGFFGSYAGGVLGGLGTLIAVYVTVKNSLYLQNESKKDSDERLQKEIERRNKEIADDKRETLIRERQRFANEIADQIGIYFTHINNYYYASVRAERLYLQLTNAKEELKKSEKAVNEAEDLIKLAAENNPDSLIAAEINKDKAIIKKDSKAMKYKEAYQEYHDNSVDGKRTRANELYFSLKTKLYDIYHAKGLVCVLESIHSKSGSYQEEDKEGKWLESEYEHLMEEFSQFKHNYIYEED